MAEAQSEKETPVASDIMLQTHKSHWNRGRDRQPLVPFQTDDSTSSFIKPTFSVRLRAHLQIMRLDHSIKNIFVIPGIVVPLSVLRPPLLSPSLVRNILVGFLATTSIACSNYVLNEVLDAPFDRLHPRKHNRPAAQGLVSVPVAYAQWLLMMAAGIALALTISWPFAFTAAALWVMGCLYNIPPFRTKDKVYLDRPFRVRQ